MVTGGNLLKYLFNDVVSGDLPFNILAFVVCLLVMINYPLNKWRHGNKFRGVVIFYGMIFVTFLIEIGVTVQSHNAD